MTVFVPIPCCFDYFIFPVLSEVWEGYASRYVIFPQDCSRNSGPFMVLYTCEGASLVAQTVKESAFSVGDLSSIPGVGRSPGGGPENPLQYSCL